MKRKYDVIFSMGATCGCSQALREAGLQLASFPFDWIGGHDICSKAQLMVDDFPGWFEPGTLTRIETPKFSKCDWYRDKFGFTPIHDFPANVPLEDVLPKVRAKYRRRVDRLSRLIDGASRVLVAYFETAGREKASPEDVAEMRSILARRWPGVAFDALILKFAEGVPLSRRKDESGEGWRAVSYDYKDRKEEDWRVDWRQVGRWLKEEYEVVDYRTAEERAQWKAASARKRYAEFKATNWWDYAVTKIQYKIYKHLRTRLDRKGVV